MKMRDEAQNRLKELKGQLHELNVKVFECQQEIERIYVDENLSFDGEFIKYFDGEEGCFVFMFVDRSKVSQDGTEVKLYGNSFKLDDDPLTSEEFDYIAWGEFNEASDITVSSTVLAGVGYSEITKISKEDFEAALDMWHRTMKEKFNLV